LIYDLVAGYQVKSHSAIWKQGEFPLFSNVDSYGVPRARMRTLIIDSEQLDSGEAMSAEFKGVAATEIQVFKNEMRTRFPEKDVSKVSDEDILREVMNTVGKKGKLGEQIHCVVSVSMLTEGWDANNVTHIMGVRAFGTQLLCEQVVGRGLRRFSYELETEGKNAGRLPPGYADVFGVPFTFATGTKIGPPLPPKPQFRVRSLEERSHLAITFPRIKAYSIKIPDERLVAKFDDNSCLTITPEDAPPKVQQQGIVGKGETLGLDALKSRRMNEVVFRLAAETSALFSDSSGNISPNRFRDLVPITRHWIGNYLTCLGGTFSQYVLWKPIAIKAAERIYRACAPEPIEQSCQYIPIVDKITPFGSSFDVDFLTRKERRHKTDVNKCHINLAVCDSNWELDFCKILESEPAVTSYVRNDGLGFEIPYTYKEKTHSYYPDFIVHMRDSTVDNEVLNLIIEIKGLKDDRDKVKADTANRLWVPAVNSDGRWGKWAFIEIMDMQDARSKLHAAFK